MTTKIQTVFIAVLLFLNFSCSKENTDSSANLDNRNGVVSASASSNALEQSMDDQPDYSILGKWILYYDWGCVGDHSNIIITVNQDGTWGGGGYTGIWITGSRMFTFTFNNSETTYSGITLMKKIKGAMSTFKGAQSSQGCFRMEPYTETFKEELNAGTRDASGKQK